jgi:pilus assembly protein Flp/PilA
MGLFKKWKDCESGATAIEYALIAGTISIGILVAVTSVGTSLQGIFQELLAGF